MYGGLGSQAIGGCANDFYAFDLASETWTNVASLPAGMERQYASGFTVNGKGYVFGGVNSILFNDLWEYNPSTNTWKQKTSMPASERYGCVNFVINNIAYIVGGKTSTTNGIPDVWAYDAVSDNWIQKTSMPNDGVWRGIAYQYSNLGIVGMGLNNSNQYNTLFYEYNTATNSWSIIPSLKHAGHTYSGYAQINQYGILFGGIDSLNVIQSTFEKIDLQNYAVTSLAAFTHTAHKGCMTFTGVDAFYLTTGVSNTKRFNSTWKVSQIVGIEDLTFNPTLSIFPNPATETITIQSKENIIKTIIIYDLFGKNIFQQEVNEKEVQLNILFSKGVYILKAFSTKNEVANHKLILHL